MSETTTSDLLIIEFRYNHVLQLARGARCSCNTARHTSVIAQEIIEYLLGGDSSKSDLSEIDVGGRSQSCPVHSSPVSGTPSRHELVEACHLVAGRRVP
jgi:hypothetical protein